MVTACLHAVQQESETGWRHISQASSYQRPAVHGRTELILAFVCARLQTIIPNLSGLEERAGSLIYDPLWSLDRYILFMLNMLQQRCPLFQEGRAFGRGSCIVWRKIKIPLCSAGERAAVNLVQTFQAGADGNLLKQSHLCCVLAESRPEPPAILHCPLSVLCLKPNVTWNTP